jgi:hypothetical protein
VHNSPYLIEIPTLSFLGAERQPEPKEMHPATSRITIDAHVRDLQRTMHPQRNKRPRRRFAWIRKGR